ncbi:hypothetical protein T09_14365 [Trichinella sp. T9]|nr:hypothetical protein T09_14365 [Trichinella sp. T9]
MSKQIGHINSELRLLGERLKTESSHLFHKWRSEATPTGELGGQEKPDWLADNSQTKAESVKTFLYYAEYFVIISMLAATCLLWETQKAEIKGYNNRRFKSKDVFHIDFDASFHVREDIINCVYP